MESLISISTTRQFFIDSDDFACSGKPNAIYFKQLQSVTQDWPASRQTTCIKSSDFWPSVENVRYEERFTR